MPAVARKDSTDTVASPDGSGVCCGSPSTQSTDQGSSNVRAEGVGVVRKDDGMITHDFAGPCCNPHTPKLTTFSGTVFANGKNLGRKGDEYSGHTISSGASTVFAN